MEESFINQALDDIHNVPLGDPGFLGCRVVSLPDYPFSVARLALITPEQLVYSFFRGRQSVLCVMDFAQS